MCQVSVSLTWNRNKVWLQEVHHGLEPDWPLGAPGQLAVHAVEGGGPQLSEDGLHHPLEPGLVRVPMHHNVQEATAHRRRPAEMRSHNLSHFKISFPP